MNHTWTADVESINDPKINEISVINLNNGFPMLDICNTKYWRKEITLESKRYLMFMKNLKMSYNVEDEEMNFSWICTNFIFE